jgi:hypothetical protein
VPVSHLGQRSYEKREIPRGNFITVDDVAIRAGESGMEVIRPEFMCKLKLRAENLNQGIAKNPKGQRTLTLRRFKALLE